MKYNICININTHDTKYKLRTIRNARYKARAAQNAKYNIHKL